MEKTAATTAHIDWSVDDDGACSIQQGALVLDEGGSSAGSFTSSAGALLQFAPGEFRLKTGASVLGSGTHEVTGGTVLAEGAASGHFDLLSGTLGSTGAGVLTLTNANTWTSGALNGQIVTGPAATLTLSTAGVKTMNTSCTLTNNGLLEMQPLSQIVGYNSVTLENTLTGTLRFAGDLVPFANIYGGNILRNRGSLQKSAGAGITTINNWYLDLYGACSALTGSIEIAADVTLQPGSHFSGPGRTRYLTGTAGTRGTIAVDSGVLEFAGGTIAGHPDGTARLSAAPAGAVEWTAGAIDGTLTFAGASSIPAGGTRQLNTSALLMNDGTLTIAGGTIIGYNSSTLRNLPGGTLRLAPAISLDNVYGGNTLINDGTLELTATGTLATPWSFTQTAGGTLRFPLGGTPAALTSGVLQTAYASLAGSFVAVVTPGLVPLPESEFYPLTYGSSTGSLSPVLATAGGYLITTIEPNRVKMKFTDVITYQAWADTYGLTGPDALPGADPDGDGLTNLVEFSLNAHPLNGAAPAGLLTGVPGTKGGTAFLFTRFAGGTTSPAGYNARGIRYIIEHSTTLGAWIPLPPTDPAVLSWTVTPAGDGVMETVRVEFPAALSRQQLRMTIVIP